MILHERYMQTMGQGAEGRLEIVDCRFEIADWGRQRAWSRGKYSWQSVSDD